ncbi:glycosyltransferase family 9 protein [Polynucleobacter paneuropaeus]|nr:glycosyltransferase family 9 protein [Polynucleobacter paneuropaeus]
MKKILFIKLGAIGDVIQASAAVLELKKQEPQTRVDWVVGSSISKLLQDLSFIDRLISIPDQALYSGSYTRRIYALIGGLFILIKNVRAYDAIYIGHTNHLYRLFTIPAILRNFPWRVLRPKIFTPPMAENRVSAYFAFLSGARSSQVGASEALLSLGRLMLANTPQTTHLPEMQTKYIVLVPGGSKNLLRDDMLRRWPVERYAELAGKFISEGYSIVLAGGKDDAWVLPYFQNLNVVNLIGKTSLMELLQIFNHSQLVVSHDTGPLHLATLTQTPILALFGPTYASAVVPLERIQLKAMDAIGMVACAPCYDGKNYALCYDPSCMKSHSVDAAHACAMKLLV